MTWFHRLIRRLRILRDRERVEREMDEEMRFHIEMEAEERARRGAHPRAARRQALLAFGGLERFKERARDARGTRLWEDALQDARYALRTLRRSPGFTAVALVTLALGIGITTAIFSVVDAVLLRPLPYSDPDRIVQVETRWEDQSSGNISPAEYIDFRELPGFAAFGVYGFGALNLTGDGEPQRVRVSFPSAGVFPALGVGPLLGRVFTAEEDHADLPVALLSEGFWRQRFAASPDVIGRTIALNDRELEVIGVMPADFQLPADIASGQRAAIFAPLGIDPAQVDLTERGSHFLRGVGRLAPGVTPGDGARVTEQMAEAMVAKYPGEYPADMRFSATARPITETVLGSARPALLVLSGAVLFVLLIVCANLSSLLLSRAESRRRELAMRVALGADRGRLLRQLLVESCVLALAGGILGLGVAHGGVELLLALQPPNVPRLESAGLDPRVAGFALAVAVLTGLGVGLLPALQISRAKLSGPLKEGRGQTRARSSERSRRALVTAQIALALALLTGAGLFTRSFLALYSVDPGFRPENVLTAQLSPPSSRYPDDESITGFYRRLIAELSQQPGVAAAGAVTNLPLATSLGDLNFEIEGRPVPEGAVSPRADWQVVTPGYLEAMGIPLLRGRSIEASDGADAPGVVVISEELAATYWPGEDALGRRFRLGGGSGPGWVTVIGIVGNVIHTGLDAEPRPQLYLAHEQFRFWGSGDPVYSMTLALRSEGAPAALTGTVRQAVRGLDPALPVAEVRVMEDVVSASLARPRLIASLLVGFSVLALVLAAVGIYGVISYGVSTRAQEFGIRMALGALSRDVIGLVIRRGLLMVLAGTVAGLLISLAVGRLLGGLLFGVSPTDPTTLIAVSAVLVAAGVLASYVPASRATRVDPMVTLRAE